MSLPLSGRLNIVKWLETFRNNGKGLNQSTIDFFDAGNNYVTNEKIDMFNKKVNILVKAINKAGITIKKTPRGRYSITYAMLKKIKLEDFTEELSKFVFDENLVGIQYDDKNITKTLSKLYKENKLIGFDNGKYFKIFADYGNIPALEWLVKTYGIVKYDINSNYMVDVILTPSPYDADIIKLCIKHNILKFDSELFSFLENFKKVFLLSPEAIKQIIPLINIQDDQWYGNTFFLKYIFEYNEDYLKLIKADEDGWYKIAEYYTNYISGHKVKYLQHSDCVGALMTLYPSFLKRILELTEWPFYNDIFEYIPEIKDIFIF